MTENRLFYVWCVLIGGVFLVSILPGNSSIYQFVAAYDTNRWAHFLVYASIAAIPTSTWRPKSNVLLSVLPAVLSIALEALQTHGSAPAVFILSVPADLFGLAAGILFGMNIRVMRSSARPLHNVNSDPSSPEIY